MDDQGLTELAATRVMGWESYDNHTLYEELVCKTYHVLQSGREPNHKACRVIFPGKTPDDVVTIFFWSPLTSLDDAWMLVEKIYKQGILAMERATVPMDKKLPPETRRLQNVMKVLCLVYQMTAAQAARTITLAALEAVGVEVKG